MKKVLGIFVVILLVVLGGYILWTQYTYSDGNRAGVLIKFSHKGNIFKTYEGEIYTSGVNQDATMGLANNKWEFSVKDKDVAEKLSHLEGKSVSLHYKEIKHAFAWQGETNYFVDNAEEVINGAPAPQK
ncbi:MAG: hypothetical protein JWO03_1748 [Bacteroidetes bacterium]|nr:hypothetical protein [Bacteroidota bacterium]